MKPMNQLVTELHLHAGKKFQFRDFRHIQRLSNNIASLLKTKELKELPRTVNNKRSFVTTDKLRDAKVCNEGYCSKQSKHEIKNQSHVIAVLAWSEVFPEFFNVPNFKTLGIINHTTGY